MFRNLLNNMPEKVREEGTRLLNELNSAPEKLAERRQVAELWVKSRLHEAREVSEDNLFTLQANAVESASDVAERAAELTGWAQIKVAAAKLEAKALTPALEGYDELNVKDISAAIPSLSRLELLKIQRYEGQNKGRKTVLSNIGKELERRHDIIDA